ADKLRANLKAANRPQPKSGYAAHHIVHSFHSYFNAQQSREILGKYGVDINDAANGVWVTGSQNSSFNAHKYMDKVYNELNQATSKQEVIDTLTSIARRIDQNAFYP
ncbi:MAG: AHH domain-containing protein, partial [Chloroflexales bacterium]|nr:AHH domain-containing protein [Chloroflexales bacterium]